MASPHLASQGHRGRYALRSSAQTPHPGFGSVWSTAPEEKVKGAVIGIDLGESDTPSSIHRRASSSRRMRRDARPGN